MHLLLLQIGDVSLDYKQAHPNYRYTELNNRDHPRTRQYTLSISQYSWTVFLKNSMYTKVSAYLLSKYSHSTWLQNSLRNSEGNRP